MKFFRVCLAIVVAAAFVLPSCSSDEVKPKGKNPDLQTSWAEDAHHNQNGVICSNGMALNMAQPGGGTRVDYCGSANNAPLPCSPSVPNWGTGTINNVRTFQGENYLVVDMALTPGWFISSCVAKVGDPETFNFDPNGVPMVNSTWEQTTINPLLNRWAMSWSLGTNNSTQCVGVAARVTVAKLNFFFPTPDPLSVRELWLYNPDYNNPAAPNMISPSYLITPWCLQPCPGDVVTVDPRTLCEDIPAFPAPTCTQTASSESVNINSSSDVICVPTSRNIGSVNFNGAGTLIIEEDANVTGGINANNGGTLIVKGSFTWNSNANINGNFKIYVMETGTLIRSSHLSMNNQDNLIVNLGTVTVGNNLTYTGKVYNAGTLSAKNINVNSSGSKLINPGTITCQQSIVANSGTLVENCGSLKVDGNLEMNGGSTVKNFCSILVDNVTHVNGSFEHYGSLVSGLYGNSDGFSIQGPTTLHDNSTIVTRNFFWSANHPLELDGNATILVANPTLNGSGQMTALSGSGRLRLSGGCSLTGQGTLTIADIDPVTYGDNPSAPNVNFPQGLYSLVNKSSDANLVIRALDPQTDIPSTCN